LQWLPEKATPVGTVFWRCCFEASLYSGTVHKKAENDCSGNSEVIFFFLRKQQQRSSTLIGAQSIQSETITYCGILDTKKRRNRIKPLSFEHWWLHPIWSNESGRSLPGYECTCMHYTLFVTTKVSIKQYNLIVYYSRSATVVHVHIRSLVL
jgi:hypothetical protein